MHRVATVSYLNALPLVDGLAAYSDVTTIPAVPSALLSILIGGGADLALCPVIDFQLSRTELEIVPVGAIGCHGPALTVQLFSPVPFDRITTVAVDDESHTSVALLQIVLHDRYGLRPRLTAHKPGSPELEPRALLLIGDKVVTSPPPRATHPYRLDLGSAWRDLYSLPFVFATWMARSGSDLGDLPDRLDELRLRNRDRLDEIVRHHAGPAGWPSDLARSYLSDNLRYELGRTELDGIEAFWHRCCELGLIDRVRPMRMYGE